MIVRSSQDIQTKLLKKAFDEGRSEEMQQEIEARIARSKITPEHRQLLDIFNATNEGQPQAIRALNVRAELDDSDVLYSDAILMAPTDGPVH